MMKWRTGDRRSLDFNARMDAFQQWHPWFAWCPVKIDWHWFWLTTVERRMRFGHKWLNGEFTESHHYIDSNATRIDYREKTK